MHEIFTLKCMWAWLRRKKRGKTHTLNSAVTVSCEFGMAWSVYMPLTELTHATNSLRIFISYVNSGVAFKPLAHETGIWAKLNVKRLSRVVKILFSIELKVSHSRTRSLPSAKLFILVFAENSLLCPFWISIKIACICVAVSLSEQFPGPLASCALNIYPGRSAFLSTRFYSFMRNLQRRLGWKPKHVKPKIIKYHEEGNNGIILRFWETAHLPIP